MCCLSSAVKLAWGVWSSGEGRSLPNSAEYSEAWPAAKASKTKPKSKQNAKPKAAIKDFLLVPESWLGSCGEVAFELEAWFEYGNIDPGMDQKDARKDELWGDSCICML